MPVMETGLVRIPEDIYDATYLGVEDKDITDSKTKQTKTLYNHKFEVIVGHPELGGKSVVLTCLSDKQVTLGNKSGRIAAAVAGKEIRAGEQFEYNDFKGRKLRLVVKDKQVQNGIKSDIKEFMSEKKG